MRTFIIVCFAAFLRENGHISLFQVKQAHGREFTSGSNTRDGNLIEEKNRILKRRLIFPGGTFLKMLK